jgi:hypothetical protein
LCLYGKFNNRLNSTSGLNGYHYINQNLLEKYEFDILKQKLKEILENNSIDNDEKINQFIKINI